MHGKFEKYIYTVCITLPPYKSKPSSVFNNLVAMKSNTFLIVFLSLLSSSLSINENRIAKAICFFEMRSADILSLERIRSVNLSKKISKECNLKVKIITEAKENKNFFVAFANPKINSRINGLVKKNGNSPIYDGLIFFENFDAIVNLSSRINQDVKFIDTKTWMVYEYYSINGKDIMRPLGFFNSSFQYESILTDSLIKRRNNLQGYNLKAMTANNLYDINIDIALAKYDNKIQMYDVTKSTKGKYYEIFLAMQDHLSFTASLHKNNVSWGKISLLKNNTLVLSGIYKSLHSGPAELIMTA